MQHDTITTLIIEDEKSAQEALLHLLKIECPEINVVGISSDALGGRQLIDDLQPELVLMDIQLGNSNSFEILEGLSQPRPHIIFVTAYNEYAIDAFRFSAVDYLLKPVDGTLLKEAVGKVRSLLDHKKESQELEVLFENLKEERLQKKKLVLATIDTIHVVEIGDIVKCQSHMNYTIFSIVGGKELIISRTLKEFEDQLSAYSFLRIHKSWLINSHHIHGFDKREGGFVILSDGSKAPVSTTKKEFLLQLIRNK